jgi:hypothetical protein
VKKKYDAIDAVDADQIGLGCDGAVPSLGSLDTPEYQAVDFCWFLTLNKNQHFLNKEQK